MNSNTCDLIFAAGTTAFSSLLTYRFLNNDSANKGPVPVHFDWWGRGDTVIQNPATGALIYPALIALINGLQLYTNKIIDVQRRAAGSGANNNEANNRTTGGGNAGIKFLRSAMPYFGRSTIMRSSLLLIMWLQEQAHQISLGAITKVNENVVRGVVIAYGAIVGLHYVAGTQDALAR